MKKKLTLKKEVFAILDQTSMVLFKGGTSGDHLFCESADACFTDHGVICNALSIDNIGGARAAGGSCNTCGGETCGSCMNNTCGGAYSCVPYDCPGQGQGSFASPTTCALPSVGCAQ